VGAVAQSAAHAASEGVTDYLSVVDRQTGAVLAESSNARFQVASESIMKLFLASYYLLLYGGYESTPQDVKDRLSYMLRYSDDATASALFTSSAIPTVAARYGLSATTNATDRAGHWGAARITAHDMTHFLYEAAHDSEVGPWLVPVMAQTSPTGSDGFNQYFGLNALSGVHGSKQGWGSDSFWTSLHSAIHSVGYTDKYFVAVLQLSATYPDPARSTATYSAKTIQAVTSALPKDGTFVRLSGDSTIYRLVGGAPVRVLSWASVGGQQPVTTLSAADWARLRSIPLNGTFVHAAGVTYRIAGGAPVRVVSWISVGGVHQYVLIDPAAITNAGTGGSWNHLNAVPLNGTFLRAGTTIYRVAGGAPLRVYSWSSVGGTHPVTIVDPAAITNAGSGGTWNHLLAYPINGTFLRTGTTIYRVAGGAPLRVYSWSSVGGPHPVTIVDPTAISHAGEAGWTHLTAVPINGTFLRTGTTIYRVAGGAPLRVYSWATVGGPHPVTIVDPTAISHAGEAGWTHLNAVPTNGTYLRAGSAIYRVAGGAPLYVTNWTPLGGPQRNTIVDPTAISHAGQPGWTHLRWTPATGTFLQGLPGKLYYRVSNGKAVHITSWTPYGGPQPYVAITQATIDRAGTGGPYNHLSS
jgi:hypothetical protein